MSEMSTVASGSTLRHRLHRVAAVDAAAVGVTARLEALRRRVTHVGRVVVVGRDVVDGAAVGRDVAVEAPLAAQHVGQQLLVGAHRHAVDRVVRAHDAERAPLLHAALEAGHVVVDQLGQRDLRVEVVARDHLAVDRRVLERVGDEVLARRDHLDVLGVLALLQPADVRGNVLAGQHAGPRRAASWLRPQRGSRSMLAFGAQ